ncbi:MAG TPA: DUF3653 domain-containing protein, partial [Gammaproteobacteria bacterium]|nr:DUF3653 domain-containing protein [Gammaproteobacteria bacterium]
MFVTDEWIVARACVHPATVRRWRARGEFPPALQRLAELEHYGELGHIDERWREWRIVAGELVAPNGERYTPGVILALALRLQQLNELERLARAPRRGPLGVFDRL